MERTLSFELALGEMEKIVERLQQTDIPLDEAVALYRRGTELAAQTESLLSAAELQVQQLTHAVRERFAEYAVESGESDEDS